MKECIRLSVVLVLAISGLNTGTAQQNAPARIAVRELRVQQVDDATHFHVQLESPPRLTAFDDARLIPQDGKALHVYLRENTPGLVAPRGEPSGAESLPGDRGHTPATKDANRPRPPREAAPVQGLEFVGKLTGTGEAKFILHYPTETPTARSLIRLRLLRLPQDNWAEIPITIDFSKAEKVSVPAEATVRRAPRPAEARHRQPLDWPARNDLEGLWAVAQMQEFGRLRGGVDDNGFYTFAIQASARKHNVPVPANLAWIGRRNEDSSGLNQRWNQDPAPSRQIIDAELYEMTTGATAIAESLATRRMLGQVGRDNKDFSIPVEKIEGITIAEHPWEQMMQGRNPSIEPIARMIPDDNYFIHFKNIRGFIQFSDLVEQWGTNLIRAYEVHSRDYRLLDRYQQQLCLRSTVLGKTLGPLVLRSLAITGSDAYLREGSDVAIVFHVANRRLFLTAVDRFIEEARAKFGGKFTEAAEEADGIKIESFTTPLREVSLYRTTLDEYVIYANSRAGMQRILDTHKGKHKPLADAMDFRYMRTIFRYDDKEETGFAYLSDAFIRQLVGPASKIKEKRRLEALTSMYMLNDAALYQAWQTGKPPTDHDAILKSAGLEPDEVYLPDGRPLAWNAADQAAVSAAYNTIRFATPLVELPIDKVTPAEAESYRQFRLQYLGLWRQYFDPIGMRIALDDKRVKLDTYILPLVANSQYNELRRVTGAGTIALNPAAIAPTTLVQYLMHLSPDVRERGTLLGFFGGDVRGGAGHDLMSMILSALDPVGNWMLIRADDSAAYGKLFDLLERSDNGQEVKTEDIARQFWQLPILVGVDVKNSLTLTAALTSARMNAMQAAPGMFTWGPLEKPYKGVSIVEIKATESGSSFLGATKAFRPAIYYAMVDGALYLTLNEATLRDQIDRMTAKREGKEQLVEINTSLFIAPAAAKLTRAVVERYFEMQNQKQALQASRAWYPLYHAGLIPDGATLSQRHALAERFYGYIPVSPDDAAFAYDRRLDEVRNERHGSPRKPVHHKGLAVNSPLHGLLDAFRTIRADLRFREDGIHTTLTIDRRPVEKP